MASRQGNARRAREARSEAVSSYIGKGIVTPGQGGGAGPPPGFTFLAGNQPDGSTFTLTGRQPSGNPTLSLVGKTAP